LNLFIPQGGHSPSAELGLRELARELTAYMNRALPPEKPVLIFLPAGRGTSAYYLARNLESNRRVTVAAVACACTTDELATEMGLLSGSRTRLPSNLQLWGTPMLGAFAKPYRPFVDAYRELLDSGLYIDLVYGGPAWHALGHRLAAFTEHEILYVHTGGLVGNESMLQRYLRHGWVTSLDLDTSARALAEVARRVESIAVP
jgi:1-aminocyclopropane-1-carboxylate deaminase/D-cysteine desulfhydrase-like pyridoxal-dependent ACC family enzyme